MHPMQSRGSITGANCSSIIPLPPRYLSIAMAPALPEAMASMIVAGPVTASPPPNTPSLIVALSLPTGRRLPLAASILNPDGMSTVCPMAEIIVFYVSVNSLPSMGMGRCRPEASGSPSFMRTHWSLSILPSFHIL